MATFKEATREALEFLRNATNVGTLATVDAAGVPHASPVYFVMSRELGHEFEFFFMTTKNSRKARDISANGRVAFSVGTGPEYIAVMMRGRAAATDAGSQDEILPVIAEYLERDKGENWPVRRIEEFKDQGIVLYRVVPDEVTFLNINSSQEPKSNADHLYRLVG